MQDQKIINFQRIATAIEYIRAHFTEQPSLETIAEKVNMSPFHFQRLFKEWAGVSPKKFLQYTSVQYAKSILADAPATLFDTADKTGLSSTGRLHDLFVKIEGMTPAEYKNRGNALEINYSFQSTIFGNLLIATTAKGVCYMGFSDDNAVAFSDLKRRFEKAHFIERTDEIQQNALKIYSKDWTQMNEVKLHLKGTEFQLKVWEALLKIPLGKLETYGAIATNIEKPKASRAVGTAIGSNPISFLIPCHRVIQASGVIGGYMWGTTRITAIIGWEGAQLDGNAISNSSK